MVHPESGRQKGLTILKRMGATVGDTVRKKVLSDVMACRALKSSLKTRGKESLKNIGRRIVTGKGSKKRRKRLSTLMKRKKLSLRRRRRRIRKGKGKCQKKKTENKN